MISHTENSYINIASFKEYIKNNPLLTKLVKFNLKIEYKYIILLFISIVIEVFVQNVLEIKKEELSTIQKTFNQIKILQKNELVVKNLLCTSEDFVKYIENVFTKNYAVNIEITANQPTNLTKCNIIPIEIKAKFIHDKFIFESVNRLHEYVGFVRIVGIKIEKEQLINGRHILNTVILCEMYTQK